MGGRLAATVPSEAMLTEGSPTTLMSSRCFLPLMPRSSLVCWRLPTLFDGPKKGSSLLKRTSPASWVGWTPLVWTKDPPGRLQAAPWKPRNPLDPFDIEVSRLHTPVWKAHDALDRFHTEV